MELDNGDVFRNYLRLLQIWRNRHKIKIDA
jgi:hypothetical protein